MKLAIIEDVQDAHDNVDYHIHHSQVFLHKEIELVADLSERIQFPYVFDGLLKNLKDFVGELMLILDLGLDLPLTTKRQLRHKYSISEDIIDEQVDGVVVALEAINNLKISPLLVVVATKYGHQDSIESFLSDHIISIEREAEVKLEFSPNGFSLANQGRASEIIDFTISRFEDYFGNRFDRACKRIQSLSHDDCQSADAITALSELLDIDFEQFYGVWKDKEQVLRDALKSMGSQTGKPLCAVGAWLYALAAYRCVQPNGNWQSKFDVNDLQADLLHRRIIPERSLESLRQSIQCFYEMCSRLFSSENAGTLNESLDKVSLSVEQGLNFILDFPCYNIPGSLYDRIQDLANVSQQGKALTQDRHKTSLAIWKFLLSSSLANQRDIAVDGMFGPPIWRINIIAEGKKTRVVFYG